MFGWHQYRENVSEFGVASKARRLWIEYFRLELDYVRRVRARRSVLGLSTGNNGKDSKAHDTANVDGQEQAKETGDGDSSSDDSGRSGGSGGGGDMSLKSFFARTEGTGDGGGKVAERVGGSGRGRKDKDKDKKKHRDKKKSSKKSSSHGKHAKHKKDKKKHKR